MGSRKQSARRREREAFRSQIGDMGDLFAQESARKAADDEHREQALRAKACESKRRYATRADAKATIATCERHGSPALYLYKCPYCGGWHLTHKRPSR